MHATASAAWVLALLFPAGASPQEAPAAWQELLERVVPEAQSFSGRAGSPPVYRAFRDDPTTGGPTLVGYAFLTSDLPPEQKGFNGPIEVLVGMDLSGRLTGIVVTDYIESHRATRGDFLAEAGFQEQYAGKSVLDAFQVRRDVDGITGATITVDAMSRGIRNAAREVAVAYGLAGVSPPPEALPLDPLTIPLGALERMTFPQMQLRGLVQQISVMDGDRTAAELALLYMRDVAVAEALIGAGMLADVFQRAGDRARERHLIFAGVDGPSAGSLNLARLSVVQAGDTVSIEPEDVLLFGPPRAGVLDGQVRMSRVLLLDAVVDMARPLEFVLDLRPGLGVFAAGYPGVSRTSAAAGIEVSEGASENAASGQPPSGASTDASSGEGRGLPLRSLALVALVLTAAAAVSGAARLAGRSR